MTVGPGFPDGLECFAVVLDVSKQNMEELIGRCRGWLSAGEWHRINRQHHAPTRDAMIVSRLLLRRLLTTMLGGAEDSFEISADAYGKPHLAQGEVQFNLSHSGAYAAVAVARTAVGIDIEVSRSLRNSARGDPFCHLGRALTDVERHLILQLPVAQRQPCLLDIWSRKEALIKCDGRGFGLDPAEICTVTGIRCDRLDTVMIGRSMTGDEISLSIALHGPVARLHLCWLDAFPQRDTLRDADWLAAHSEQIELRPWPGDPMLHGEMEMAQR
jgi:4'-phosphopantetheinyl transferase